MTVVMYDYDNKRSFFLFWRERSQNILHMISFSGNELILSLVVICKIMSGYSYIYHVHIILIF